MSMVEWNGAVDGPYHPTCPHALISTSVISAFEAEAGVQARAGKIVTATATLERLNGWLMDSGQFDSAGKKPTAILASALAEEGRSLARDGDVDEAIVMFEEALTLNPLAGIEPMLEANLHHGLGLLHRGAYTESMAALDSVLSISPTLDITSTLTANAWNSLCWNGTLAGVAAAVMPACERAVASEPEDGGIRDSRGLAHALIGDIEGAVADFEFYVTWVEETGRGRNVDWRQDWIAALKAGEDPFDEATLEALGNQ